MLSISANAQDYVFSPELLSIKVTNLENRVNEIESIMGDKQTYVGASLEAFDAFARQNNMELSVSSIVSKTLVKEYYAIVQACFKKIREDFPNSSIKIDRIELYGNPVSTDDQVSYVFGGDTLQLFSRSDAQSCYNAVYSRGLNR